MDTINSQSQGGGKTTLYIVVFFLCVISAIVGYFQYSLTSKQGECDQKVKDIQAKAAADLRSAKTDEEKREIQRKADLEIERAKIKTASDAEKKALADREAKIKAAEAAVNKKLADATATVKNAQKLQDDAKKVKADADKKKKDADAAMAKAVASGNAVDKKLADEKKRLADEADKKVAEANKKAEDEKKKAQAEAKKALDLKGQLDKVTGQLSLIVSTVGENNAVPGYYRSGTAGAYLNRGPDTSDPKVCRDWAKKEHFAVWGHRNKNHPDPKFKDTCFAYEKVTTKYGGDPNDKTHMVGCTYGDLRPDQTVCSLPENFYRYVRIMRQKIFDQHHLNLGGVDIMSDGKNVATKATITASSTWPGTSTSSLIDQNQNTIAHTLDGNYEWFMFDLGKRMAIDRVVIWNRRDCCQNRAEGIQVQLSNDGLNWITSKAIGAKQAQSLRHQFITGEDKILSD